MRTCLPFSAGKKVQHCGGSSGWLCSVHPPHPQPWSSPDAAGCPRLSYGTASSPAVQIPPMPCYRDGGRRHATRVARQHAAQQQHPEALGTGHQCVSHGGGQCREHDAQLTAQAVVEEHGAEPPCRRSQREHRLQGHTERGLNGSGLFASTSQQG